MFHRHFGLPVIVLRTSRFFPEPDDSRALRESYADANVKANEYLARRVDIEDAADAHLLAAERASAIGFGRYIVSATTPFEPQDMAALRDDAPAVVRRRVPSYEAVYAARGWRMFPTIDRVYVNAKAREDLGWQPRCDFNHVVACLRAGQDPRSPLARAIGAKGYHAEAFAEGPYPVE
jgi:nucleoside-diphosphate-sugar epimerase